MSLKYEVKIITTYYGNRRMVYRRHAQRHRINNPAIIYSTGALFNMTYGVPK